MQRYLVQSDGAGHIVARYVARLLLGAVMIAGAVLAAGQHTFGARAQTTHTGHMAVINPLLTNEVQAMTAHRTQLLRDHKAGTVSVMVRSQHSVSHDITRLGGTVIASIGGIVTAAHLPPDRLDDLARIPGVVSLAPNLRSHSFLDQSIPEIRANQAWFVNDHSGLPLQGYHSIVAVVDSGIDWHNSDFKNSDGTTRIKYIWDESISGRAPTGFKGGFECDSALINAGKCPEKDIDGHGTHVAGIAAGNGAASGGREVGVAPRADLIIVKSNLSDEQNLAAWQYIIQKAQQLHEPVAINNSFGGEISPHDGTSDLDVAADHMVGPGHVLVAAAGNEGNKSLHASGRLGQGATTSIPFTFTGGDSSDTIGLFYSAKDAFTAQIRNTDTGAIVGPVTEGHQVKDVVLADGDTDISIVDSNWDSSHRVVLVDIASKHNRLLKGHYSLDLGGATVADSGHFDAWMESDIAATFNKPDESDTIGDPADSRSIIAVGNYATRLDWADRSGTQHNVCDIYTCDHGNLQLGQIAFSSSVGPTEDGRQKPEISAPGTMIASSLSHDALMCDDPNAGDECVDSTELSNDGVSRVIRGTSMSAPHVAGVAALMLQANPTLNQTTITTILKNTARHDNWTGGGWTPTYGAGKLDALGAVQAALAAPQQPTATPTPVVSNSVNFSVQAVRVQAKNKSGAAAANTMKSSAKGYVFIYWRAVTIPASQKPKYSYTAMLNGKVVAKSSFTGTKPSYPAGNYSASFSFKPTKTGTYIVNGTVTVGSTVRQGSTSVTIVKALH